MFKSYIKLFFRNLYKNKALSTINLVGFILGLLSTLLILEYVYYERSYESFHTKSERIYRVAYNRYKEGKELWKTANSFYPTGNYLKENFDEVEEYFTYQRNYDFNLTFKDQYGGISSFNVDKAYYVTPSIFNMLTFEISHGSVNNFNEPNMLAISETAAKKCFGSENPLGKVLTLNHHEEYTVTTVFKDLPSNTHLKTDYFFSLATIVNKNRQWIRNWGYD